MVLAGGAGTSAGADGGDVDRQPDQPGHQTALDALGARTQPIALFALAERLNGLTPYGQHTLNVKMQAEDLLIDYLHFWQQKH